MLNIIRLWAKRVFFAAMALLLACLAVMSALRTTTIGQNETHDDIAALGRDAVWPHLLFLPLLGLAVFLLRKKLAAWDPKILTWVMAGWMLALGLLWIYAAQVSPRADQGAAAWAASDFAKNEYWWLQNTDYPYFRFYPFQLGFTRWLEAWFRGAYPLLLDRFHVPQEQLFDTAAMAYQAVNVLLLCGACLLLLWWLRLALPEKRAPQNLLALGLMGFTPAILYCSFVYGVMPGLFFSLLAAAFQMKFIRSGKIYWVPLAAVSIALACLLKPNSMIVLAALCIQLLLYFCKDPRKWLRLAMIPLCAACVLLAGALPQKTYERRADVELGGGIPRLAWLAMGLADTSKLGPGWWDPQYSTGVYYEAGGDPAQMNALTREILRAQLKDMADNPRRTLRFFLRKAESQWCEPTYESVWLNAACGHGESRLQGLAQSVYDGLPGRALQQWMDLAQTALYALAALGAVFQLKKPKTGMLALPVAVFGGFLYHQLFEGKSQYIFPYALLLLPLAACGLWQAVEWTIAKMKGKAR